MYTAIMEASPEDIAGAVSRILQMVVVRALFDYETDDEEEIGFKVGEHLILWFPKYRASSPKASKPFV